MKNIHIIPTDKPSRLYFVKDKLKLSPLKFTNDKEVDWLTHNLYITNDEKIKVGDWVIEFQKGDNIGEVHFINGEYVIANDIQKKIILTTDQDLIKDGVQAIDDEFLEWFVKNPSCEEVEVFQEKHHAGEVVDDSYPKGFFDYKIIIPKEEQKELRRKLFTLIKSLEEETKQETLEEAAERLCLNIDRPIFIQGAQWQQERMYSEEDMAESFIACWKANVLEGMECKLSFKEWFEQFKKK